MSEAFLMRRGGKKDVLDVGVALICAKFPTGSTCACEKDGRRLSSDSASGVAAFSVPEAGTWTLTITDGAQVKSGSATVAQGDVEILTLAYDPDELVILSPDGGLASGYSGVGGVEGARVETGGNKVTTYNQCYLSPAIDLTDYDTLTVIGKVLGTQGGWDTTLFVDPDYSKCIDSSAAALTESIGLTEATHTLDVSALTGTHYIGVSTGGNSTEFTYIVLA